MIRNRNEVDETLVSHGFVFLCYTWLPSQNRAQYDEELWLNPEGLFLWINYVDLVAWLYKRVGNAPRGVKWELITKPGEPFAVYASEDQRWVRIVFPPQSTEWLFHRCAEVDDFVKEGIPVTCEG